MKNYLYPIFQLILLVPMQPHLFKITLDVLPDLTKENLRDLGIDVIIDILAII